MDGVTVDGGDPVGSTASRAPVDSLMDALGAEPDATEARRASRELAEARDLFAGILDAATEQAIIGLDIGGVIRVFNRGAERMLGLRADDVVGVPTPPALHDDTEVAARIAELGLPPGGQVGGLRSELLAVVGRAAHGEPETRQWTYLTAGGARLQVMTTTTARRDGDGVITGFLVVGTDITARVAAERALRDSESMFEKIFDNAPTGIMLLDGTRPGQTRTVRVNPALCRITGYTAEQLLEMPVGQLVHPDHRGHDHTDSRPPGLDAEWRWQRADGRDIWVAVNVSPISTEPGGYLVAMVEDVTARRDAEERLHHLALHDALTGLPNRSLLLDRLGHALAAAGRDRTQVAVLYLDLDGFKAVNDESGHLAGDDVLRTVAQRLTGSLRPGDTVARMGGDEFVVLAPGFTAAADAQALAERLLVVLAEPYEHGRTVYHLSASIGIAVSVTGSTAENLLREADDAMYVAKDDGKNRVFRSGTYDAQSLTRTARAARFLQVEAELRRALDQGELVMHAQPVLDLGSGTPIAVETLIRWEHPRQGLLYPADFLDVAETSPLILPLGRRVLAESCRLAAGLPDPDDPLAVYVNISGRQLEAGSLRGDVLAALDESGLPADRLVLELTETFTPLIAGSLLGDLADLRRRGVRLAIDDVGTGYSSLSRLTELPVDILKIDRGFVARMAQNAAAYAVVKAILTIGTSLGLQVVGEGVEEAEQEAILRDLGCTIVQGYRYSRPLSEQVLVRSLRAGASFVPADAVRPGTG